MHKPDSLIFDMDGTLWDNVDSYVISWNIAFEKTEHNKIIGRDDILGLMGKEAAVMLKTLLPDDSEEEHNRVFEQVTKAYQQLVPTMKPIIFEGVHDGLEKLSAKYKLFMLSNCEENGLVNFMNHTKTRHLFTDYMEHGMNLKPKSFNMKLLVEKHGLQYPVYVGDTESDSKSSQIADVPFVFVTYGFGTTTNYAMKFDSFPELTEYFINL
ncbi:MAG: HAD family hydrolase [Dysgonamonadaceae bacterium]|jgi:phosphoglycolate phosphatase|nr:HAD family hydrolase [Dysgonamonadaceae bacterium]MDD3310227.1 HAD family hydrolase [Dysgonamonadaceae bacterium]MDD3900025.1 HAD family hydrolase [Dysgonamonadaceae bacterium]MDD4398775.1 HAD family hydrolase [Dysgonamonadaceae bacterium]MEA5082351.1 HAD family hydrolase [Dysgonamonadaceae bacterium]